MKAYVRKNNYNFEFPKDMHKIIDYLETNGTLNVGYYKLERLFKQFSQYQYGAYWLTVDNYTIDKFADWLERKDV